MLWYCELNFSSVLSTCQPIRDLHFVSTLLRFFLQTTKTLPQKLKPHFRCHSTWLLCWRCWSIGRDILLLLTVQDWDLIVGFELGFAAIIGVGFLMHALGYAPAGVITSCLAGVGSATAFIVLLGWGTVFHLWYVNLAVLLVAVPIRVILKAILAGLIIILYGGMFFIFPIMTGTSMPPRSP